MLSRRLACLLGAWSLAGAERIWINQSDDGWRIMSDADALGHEGTIRGAGGFVMLSQAAAAGADALRTWDLDQLNGTLETAEALGLKISAGIWLDHDGSHYQNCTDMDNDDYWQSELSRILHGVRAYKNSSAVLWWTVGNEIELPNNVTAGTDCIWRRVEWVAQRVKAEDPNHPVGTVLAGTHKLKVQNIARLCPSLDFLGVNSYGEASLLVGSQLKSWGWTLPYALMEFGPTGHWASPVTAWGSYIEESSSEKVPRYDATCHGCYDDPLCIGSFAFVWGWKWEKTGTWYGVFNSWPEVTENVPVNCPECESEVVGVLQKCWTGEHKETVAPSIESVSLDGAVLDGMRFSVDLQLATLSVNATQPQGKPLTALWAVTEEVVSTAIGGAFEDTNPLLEHLFVNSSSNSTGIGLSVQLNASRLDMDSSYRLYIFVREDPKFCGDNCSHHESVASLPFHICHDALEGEECFSLVSFALDGDLAASPGKYPGVNASSSFQEVQMSLAQKKVGSCHMPCSIQEWCHTAQPGEECHSFVQWLLADGAATAPDALRNLSGPVAAQLAVHENLPGICTRPCLGVESLPCEPLCGSEETPPRDGVGDETPTSAAHASGFAALLLLAVASSGCWW
eukprot:gb/GFBE01015523.1/.p1 GENE.gb/GFBE01015523.1/~~gb/GFBE01015523.1/.p1  ORF type:complete len:625 (+),score=124.42 gb/GFBE01015523.1/:1-1875(+)